LDALERKLEESPTPNFGLQVLGEEFARLRFAHRGEARDRELQNLRLGDAVDRAHR